MVTLSPLSVVLPQAIEPDWYHSGASREQLLVLKQERANNPTDPKGKVTLYGPIGRCQDNVTFVRETIDGNYHT